MPTTYPIPVIPANQYDSFRSDSGMDLPDTYDEWLKLIYKQRDDLRRKGETVREVEVDFDEFSRFCATRGTTRNRKTLLDFAIEKSRGQ